MNGSEAGETSENRHHVGNLGDRAHGRKMR